MLEQRLSGYSGPRDLGRFPLPLIGWVYIRRGEILYEWNELEQAGDHLTRGLERAELGGDVPALIAGYLLAGRLQLAAGHVAAAAAWLDAPARWWKARGTGVGHALSTVPACLLDRAGPAQARRAVGH